MFYELYIFTGIFVLFGLYVLYKTKESYGEGKPLSSRISLGWWILDAAWSILVILAALYNIWPLPIEGTIALVSGLTLLIVGFVVTLAGIIEFRSMRKVSGVEISNLITTGIYHWSRNPQFFGMYLSLIGISLLGRSGYALLLALIAIIYCHYYIINAEEPYLAYVFGEEYISYKQKTPRYIGIPKREKMQ